MDLFYIIHDWFASNPKIIGVLFLLMGLSMFFIEVEPGIYDVTFAPLICGLGIFMIVSKNPFGKYND